MRPCIQWMVLVSSLLINVITIEGEVDFLGIVFRQIKDGQRVERYSKFVNSTVLAEYKNHSDQKHIKEVDVSTLKVLSISEGYCQSYRKFHKFIRVVVSIDYREPKPHKKHRYIIYYLEEEPVHVSFVNKHKPRHNPIVIRVEDKAEIDHYSKIFADTVAKEFKHIDKPILAYYKWLLDENMDSAMTVHSFDMKAEPYPRGMSVKFANGTILTEKNRVGEISPSRDRCPNFS